MDHYKGNFFKERSKNNGWIIGRFLNDIRKTEFIAVKSWEFKKGQETNHSPKYEREATEIDFILKGKTRGLLDGKEIILEEGDYVVIPPKMVSNLVEEIMEDAEGLTVKFPSLSADDSVKLSNQYSEQTGDYKKIREKILVYLGIVILIFIVVGFLFLALQNENFVTAMFFGFASTFLGLFVRNLIFISGAVEEKAGKYVGLAYVAYSTFILIFSFLVSSIIVTLIDEIPETHLYWALLTSINFSLGLVTYSFINMIMRALNKLKLL